MVRAWGLLGLGPILEKTYLSQIQICIFLWDAVFTWNVIIKRAVYPKSEKHFFYPQLHLLTLSIVSEERHYGLLFFFFKLKLRQSRWTNGSTGTKNPFSDLRVNCPFDMHVHMTIHMCERCLLSVQTSLSLLDIAFSLRHLYGPPDYIISTSEHGATLVYNCRQTAAL